MRTSLIQALAVGAFIGAFPLATLLRSQAAPPTPSPAAQAYTKIDINEPDVQAAVKVALANQRKQSRAISLRSIVSAERQAVSANNLRLCLSMDRSGRTEFARVVLSRNTKKQWSVSIWAWGSCGR
jgi:hypothetical protein